MTENYPGEFAEIYTLEKIDPRSIRPMQSKEILPAKEEEAALVEPDLFSSLLEGSIAAVSWLKSLLWDYERPKLHCFLSFYGLKELLSLSPQEYARVKRLSQVEKDELRQSIWSEAQSRAPLFFQRLEQVVNRWIAPWMRERQGLVFSYEVEELLTRCSAQPQLAASVWRCFSDLYAKGLPFYHLQLRNVAPTLYAIDEAHENLYHAVVKCARGFFYRREMTYPLAHLLFLCYREGARRWLSYPEPFVEKVLRISPTFRTRRFPPSGELAVHLS